MEAGAQEVHELAVGDVPAEGRKFVPFDASPKRVVQSHLQTTVGERPAAQEPEARPRFYGVFRPDAQEALGLCGADPPRLLAREHSENLTDPLRDIQWIEFTTSRSDQLCLEIT
jgi:hypothetical protein